MESKTKAALRPGALTGKPVGGYAFVSVANILRVWHAYQCGEIRFRDVRVWFACHEQLARRCELEDGRLPHFTTDELRRMVGGGAVKASISRLQASKLLCWSNDLIRFPNATASELDALAGLPIFALVKNNRRSVPVPRVSIKLMAQSKPAVVAAMLGHMLRCLYYRNGEPVSWGRCKASWIAEVFGLTLRSIKAARKHLLSLGWLIELESQWRERQQWGGTFAVNLNLKWTRPGSYADASTPSAASVPKSEISPRPVEIEVKLSPPYINRELPSEFKNQKPACVGRPGVSIKVGEEKEKPPTWKHIEPRDLRDTGRLLDLYEQAKAAGALGHSEANLLRFVTAAEHATVKGTKNPCGLFIDLVKKKLWHYCTEGDEEAARARLKQTLYGVSRVRPPAPPPPKPKRVELSDDERLAQAIESVATQKKIPPMVLIRQMRPSWTLEHFENLLAAAELTRLGRVVHCQKEF
jgi:hypothetical protein